MLKPREPMPTMAVDTVGAGKWILQESKPLFMTMIIIYRGHHCPACKLYLKKLEHSFDEFRERGIEVIAISSNDEALARKTKQEWELEKLTIGYGLPIDQARSMGLYISKAVKASEPEVFIEPAIFLVKPDHTLYAAYIQSTPFARPQLSDLLKALDYIKAKDYPARGEA